jgi:hypothetical protein
MILARDLALAQQDQRLTRRQVRARRLVEQAVELVADAGELQSRQHGLEPIGRCLWDAIKPMLPKTTHWRDERQLAVVAGRR